MSGDKTPFTPVIGHFGYIRCGHTGQPRWLFKIVGIEKDIWGETLTVTLEEMGGGRRTSSIRSLTMAEDQAAAEKEFNSFQEEMGKRRREALEEQRRRVRETVREQESAVAQELAAFMEWCDQNPATRMDGDLWERLRNLSEPAQLGFFDVLFYDSTPKKEPSRH